MNMNLDLNRLGSIGAKDLDDEAQRKRIMDYLYQLTEQLRYWQNNLEPENFSEETRNGWVKTQEGVRAAASRIEEITDGGQYVSRLVNSAMTLTPDDWSLIFGEKTVMRITAETADIAVDTLSVDGDIVGNVVNTQPGITYTVDSGNINSMKDLQAFIDGLGKYLTGPVLIEVKAPLTGGLYLRGFKSGANDAGITVDFSGNGCLFGSINVYYCDRVTVSGAIIRPATSSCGIRAVGVGYIDASSCTVDMYTSSYTGSKVCYRLEQGSRGVFSSCCALGGAFGFQATGCSMMQVDGCWGGQAVGDYGFTNKAIRASSGSVVHVTGSVRPLGTCDANGGTITVAGNATETPLADNLAPAYPYQYTYAVQVTATPKIKNGSFGGTVISTVYDETNIDTAKVKKHTADTDGRIRSGPADGKYHYGVWYFGTANTTEIKDPGNGYTLANMAAATVRLTRAASEGGNRRRCVDLYYYKTRVSGPSANDTQGQYFADDGTPNLIKANIEVSLGKSKTITLGAEALAALKAGDVKGFCVAGTGYMEFEPEGCELTMYWDTIN